MDNQSAEDIITHLLVLFEDRLSELNILEKFKEFKSKFKHSKGKNEYRKLYSEMILEYNDIIDRANEIWKFDCDLLRSLELKGKDNINKVILND